MTAGEDKKVTMWALGKPDQIMVSNYFLLIILTIIPQEFCTKYECN